MNNPTDCYSIIQVWAENVPHHGTPCSTSVLIPLQKVSLLEQLVINKPRHPWNYDRLNTTPSSLILHPSIHPITYPFIPRLPTAVCMYWHDDEMRRFVPLAFQDFFELDSWFWARTWGIKEQKKKKIVRWWADISHTGGFILLIHQVNLK